MRNQPDRAPLEDGGEALAIRSTARDTVRTPSGGWLRAARLTRGISQQHLATKLGFRRQAWAQLETSEAREAISLYSLRRAADALRYDLVYFLVPRANPAEKSGAVPDGAGRKGEAGDRPAVEPEANGIWSELELPTELR